MSFDLKIVDGDLSLSNKRDLAVVEREEKLIQDILKIVSTPLGSNFFHPWYGSPITSTLVGTAYTSNFISAVATTQLRNSLEALKSLQAEQVKSNQIVTPQEQIASIQNVAVDRNVVDPRFFSVVLTVLNKVFRQVETSFAISL